MWFRHKKIEIVPQVALPMVKRSATVYDRNMERCRFPAEFIPICPSTEVEVRMNNWET
jgi:hypothetical protein